MRGSRVLRKKWLSLRAGLGVRKEVFRVHFLGLTGKLQEEVEKNYEQILEKKIGTLEDQLEKYQEHKEMLADKVKDLTTFNVDLEKRYADLEIEYYESQRKNEELER